MKNIFKEYEALKDVVKDVPLLRDPKTCPYCGSKNVSISGCMSTMLGWKGPVDPNHHWWPTTCQDCKKEFVKERTYENYWYTDKRERNAVLLAGVPSCFESYSYNCNCGGLLTRTTTKLDGETNTNGVQFWDIVDGKSVPQFRTFYNCDKCGLKKEI